ncbi:MAG TPA: hypothetical protein PLD35_06170 [Caldisericia bacterium]|nr:hypothetical protein [Caldisericia bacterium]
MRNKVLRCIIAALLLFSIFNVPFDFLNAESRNSALIDYEDSAKIGNYIQKGFKISELYSEYFLSEINEEQKPSLFISPELNKNEYYPDDDIRIKMQIMNKSNRGANDVKFTMTLPQEIKYVKTDEQFKGLTSVIGNIVTFEIGQIVGMSTTTFDIYCKVKNNVRIEKSVDIIFDVTCKEESTDRREVHLLIKLKRGEARPLYLGIYLKNIKVDPDTGEFYIDFDTSLELILRIDGGSAPYTLNIDWGDGSSKEEKKISGGEINLSHKFESRGSMGIKFEVSDLIGRTKKAIFKLKIK